MVPVRHALGALLLERGLDKDIIEAEIVYRADLDKYPDNIWALSGLKKCLFTPLRRTSILLNNDRQKNAYSPRQVSKKKRPRQNSKPNWRSNGAS